MGKIGDVYKETKGRFLAAGIETPDLDAQILIESAFGIKKEDIFLNQLFENNVSSKKLEEYVLRRLKHEPVSKILGEKYFWKHKFKVSSETLDPRPDSETIIETTLKYLPDKLKKMNILDFGTGTGCLILSLLHEYPNAKGVAVDISSAALSIAKENAKALGVEERLDLINSSWENFEPPQKFELIVSNPPYIKSNNINLLSDEVKLFDPLISLDGGGDGLSAYRFLSNHIKKMIDSIDNICIFEIGYDQSEAVSKIFKDAGFRLLEIVKDLAGNDRCIVVKL